MNIPHRHLVKLLVNEDLKIGFDELITDTLRMRPDRIIVGEVRSANEVKALMNTMLAGQGKGSFSTFHAQNSEEALIRLKNLGISPADLCSLDLIVVQRRWTKYSGGASDVRRVVEIACLEKDSRIIRLFEYSPGKDQLEKRQLYNTGVFRKICFNFGFGRKGFEREIGRRTKLLERKPDSFEGFFSEANRLMMDDY